MTGRDGAGTAAGTGHRAQGRWLRVERADGEGTVASHVRHADRLWLRFRGLMGAPDLPPGDGLLLDPCNSVHMFFMRFPIDAVYLDRNGVVLAIVSPLRPWHLGPVLRRAHSVLEVPAGTCAGAVRVGDTLLFRPEIAARL